jgi:hypothetical protein
MAARTPEIGKTRLSRPKPVMGDGERTAKEIAFAGVRQVSAL